MFSLQKVIILLWQFALNASRYIYIREKIVEQRICMRDMRCEWKCNGGKKNEMWNEKLLSLQWYNILCSSWIHDCGKMVDRQKALLMVLLALLIYPNDIFGKWPRRLHVACKLNKHKRRKRGFDQFANKPYDNPQIRKRIGVISRKK